MGNHVHTTEEIDRLASLAADCMETGQYDEASAVLAFARAHHADTVELLLLCGILALRRLDAATARIFLLRALARDRENPLILRNLAAAYHMLGDYSRAKALAANAWESDPRDLGAIGSLAAAAWAC